MYRVLLARAMLSAGRSHAEPAKILTDVIERYPDRDAASFGLLTLARMAKKDDLENVASLYKRAFDMRYYSSDSAPVAMYEYGTWLKETANKLDSANAVFDELTKRYLIETNIGAKAQLQIVSTLIASGEHAKAITRLERITSAHSDDAIGASATLEIAEQCAIIGEHTKALATFDHVREVFDLSGEQLGESYLGSARSEVKLGKKKVAITALRKMLTLHQIPQSKRQQAQTLLQTLAPAKKKKK